MADSQRIQLSSPAKFQIISTAGHTDLTHSESSIGQVAGTPVRGAGSTAIAPRSGVTTRGRGSSSHAQRALVHDMAAAGHDVRTIVRAVSRECAHARMSPLARYQLEVCVRHEADEATRTHAAKHGAQPHAPCGPRGWRWALHHWVTWTLPTLLLVVVGALYVLATLEEARAIPTECLLGICSARNASASRVTKHVRLTTNFTYEAGADTGPAHWGELAPEFALCGAGQQQSPVDVSSTVRVEAVSGVQRSYTNKKWHVVSRPAHPGFHLEADVGANNGYMMVHGARFDLVQFHFHRPSEHTFDGKEYPLEGHFVHRAVDGSNRIAVFGVVYDYADAGARHAGANSSAGETSTSPEAVGHPLLATFWPYISEPTQNVYADAGALMQDVEPWIYRYNGSLTTPPCTQGVAWHVAFALHGLSASQLDAFDAALGFEANSRPVQPLLGRVVHEYALTDAGLRDGAGGVPADWYPVAVDGAGAGGGHDSRAGDEWHG